MYNSGWYLLLLMQNLLRTNFIVPDVTYRRFQMAMSVQTDIFSCIFNSQKVGKGRKQFTVKQFSFLSFVIKILNEWRRSFCYFPPNCSTNLPGNGAVCNQIPRVKKGRKYSYSLVFLPKFPGKQITKPYEYFASTKFINFPPNDQHFPGNVCHLRSD